MSVSDHPHHSLSTEETTGYSNDPTTHTHKPVPGTGQVTDHGPLSHPEGEREREPEPERHSITGRSPKR
jgi:hypothetical protein